MIDIVALPDAPFDAPLWTNRQHMALELAATGRARVLYVEPGRLRGAGGPRLGSVGRDVWVLRTRLPVPYRAALRTSTAGTMAYLAHRARSAARQLQFATPVLWSYTPLGWSFRNRFRPSTTVYDLVDDYLAQRNYAHLRLEAAHEQLVRAADLVLCTTDDLRAQVEALGAPRVTTVGNAADVDLFARARSMTPPSRQRPYLLFWGAVTEDKLDLELIADLTTCLPADLDLVFIGPATNVAAERLRSLPRTHLLPAHAPGDLIPFVAGALACFIPYRASRYTASVSALKLYEAFAAGKQVIASDFQGIRAFAAHVHIAGDADGWVAATQRVRSGVDLPMPSDIQSHSWRAKAERCLELVEGAASAS